MTKSVLIGFGLFVIVVTVLFASGAIEVISGDELVNRALAKKKMAVIMDSSVKSDASRETIQVQSQEESSTPSIEFFDLEKIRDLVAEGEYQEALDTHLWYHEESKKSASLTGVRLSFALSSWLELGKKYPPAIDALKAVRDDNRTQLLSKQGAFSEFHDLFAINRVLGLDVATVELFFLLEAQTSESDVKMFYSVVEDLLIEKEHFHFVRKYIGDPILKFESLRYMRETSLSFAKTSSGAERSLFLESADKTFTEGVLKLVNVAKAIGHDDAAVEIQKRALDYFDSDKIESAVH